MMPFAWWPLSLKCLCVCVCVWVSACVCPCSLIPNPVFLMPSALYGFLFLSDCTHGSYRDGSHAMRWKHSALDQGSSHLTHTKTLTHKHTYRESACLYISINACTHPGDHESVKLSYIQIYGSTCAAHMNTYSFMPLHLCGAHLHLLSRDRNASSVPSGLLKHLQRASLKLSVCTSWQTALWSKRTHLLTNGSIQVTPEQIENEIELKQTELIQSEGGELIAGASHRIVVKWYEREFIHSRSFAQLILIQGPSGIKIVSQWD